MRVNWNFKSCGSHQTAVRMRTRRASEYGVNSDL